MIPVRPTPAAARAFLRYCRERELGWDRRRRCACPEPRPVIVGGNGIVLAGTRCAGCRGLI